MLLLIQWLLLTLTGVRPLLDFCVKYVGEFETYSPFIFQGLDCISPKED